MYNPSNQEINWFFDPSRTDAERAAYLANKPVDIQKIPESGKYIPFVRGVNIRHQNEPFDTPEAAQKAAEDHVAELISKHSPLPELNEAELGLSNISIQAMEDAGNLVYRFGSIVHLGTMYVINEVSLEQLNMDLDDVFHQKFHNESRYSKFLDGLQIKSTDDLDEYIENERVFAETLICAKSVGFLATVETPVRKMLPPKRTTYSWGNYSMTYVYAETFEELLSKAREIAEIEFKIEPEPQPAKMEWVRDNG